MSVQLISTAVPDDQVVQLQVGERRFTTHISTLYGNSGFFRALFSGRWHDQAEPDGSIFIDCNGDTFSIILDFLRQNTFPIFFDNTAGHDEVKYNQVRAQADYLQIDSLVNWIDTRGYLDVIHISTTTAALSATRLATYLQRQHARKGGERMPQATHEITQIGTRKQYICANGQIITTQIDSGGIHIRFCRCDHNYGRVCVPVGDPDGVMGRLMGEENTYVVVSKSVVRGGSK